MFILDPRVKGGFMGKIDKIKESIGYLKVVFSIMIAIDVSLIAWLYQNFEKLQFTDGVMIFVVGVLLTFGIIVLNKKILSKIDDLEEL